jgi:hypothetical protein
MMIDFADEATLLLAYLEERNLTEKEACAVISIALQSLIANPAEARVFIRVLADQLRVADELRATH